MTFPQPCPLTITTTDGIELSASRLGRSDTPATIVYVHGLLTDASYWTPLTQHLHHQLGGAIGQITYDQRGHGGSGWPTRSTGTTLRHLADDLDIVLAHATGAVILAAHSAGSLVAHAYVKHHPERAAALSGLVLFNGACEFPEFPSLPRHFLKIPARLRRLRHGRFDRIAAAGYVLLERRFRSLSKGLGSKALLIAGQRHGDPRVLADLLHSYGEHFLEPATAVAMRSIPSFVLSAERDRVVPPTQSMRLADAIWADYEIVPGAGHSLPHTDPQTAGTAILQALEVAYRDENPADSARGAQL
ncbi:alpha/beta hydrolase [Nocardia sp. NPDC052112]|uniref:alpha/beta fold hydrolase n=1 Tax=Nocardia sp. NPDC052112 TaxID=3155646 RepID=UPI003449EE4E